MKYEFEEKLQEEKVQLGIQKAQSVGHKGQDEIELVGVEFIRDQELIKFLDDN